MSISKIISIVSIIIIISCTCLGIFIAQLYKNSLENNLAIQQEVILTSLATELSTSTSELTRFARIFTATGNPKAKQTYHAILDERNGKIPRKETKLVAPGETIDLISLMKLNNCTDNELEKINLAKQLSDELSILEIEVMMVATSFLKNPPEKFSTATQADQAYVLNLLFNNNYQREVDKIHAALTDFFIMLQKRIEAKRINTSKLVYQAILTLGIAITVIFILSTLFILWSRIKLATPLTNVTEYVKQVSDGNLKRTSPPIYKNEIGQLTSGVSIMVEKLTELTDRAEEKLNERTITLQLLTLEAQEAKKHAEDATKIKSQFLANMSHEIRTPMNAILGLSSILATAGLDESHTEHAKKINHSSSILLNIINDILDITKLETNNFELVPDHYILMQSVGHTSSLLRGMAEAKNLKYQFTFHGNTAICLYGDDIRLRQVLINLLSNSIKFTEKGTVSLDVHIKPKSIDFVIKDTGMGIKNSEIGKIFDTFHQTDIVSNRNIQGTGLGLPICKNIATLMGGTITVASTYKEGTTFTLTIPKILGDANLIREEVQNQSVFTTKDTNILVVDDIYINLYVARALLGRYGVNITTVNSGLEAIKCVKTTKFDIIFMDHYMPTMTGIETTKIIRSMGTPFDAIPIIALTANAMLEDRIIYKEATMNDFLSKPIEPHKLHTILEFWIPEEKRIYQDTDPA